MDASFQIGKELGELRARIDVLESRLECQGCGCHNRNRKSGLLPSEMTPLQRDVVKVLNDSQCEISNAVMKVIESKIDAKGHKVAFQGIGVRLTPLANLSAESLQAECVWICCNGDYYCCPAETCCAEEPISSEPEQHF